MLCEEEIHAWWEIKIKNYLKNYAQLNKLILVQAKVKKFIKTREKFLEMVPLVIKKILKSRSWPNYNTMKIGC